MPCQLAASGASLQFSRLAKGLVPYTVGVPLIALLPATALDQPLAGSALDRLDGKCFVRLPITGIVGLQCRAEGNVVQSQNDPGSGGFEASSRLEGELGYGLPAFGGGFTSTPNIGFGLSDDGARDYLMGWRLAPAGEAADFSLNLEGTRRESANDDAPVEHGVMLRGALRW